MAKDEVDGDVRGPTFGETLFGTMTLEEYEIFRLGVNSHLKGISEREIKKPGTQRKNNFRQNSERIFTLNRDTQEKASAIWKNFSSRNFAIRSIAVRRVEKLPLYICRPLAISGTMDPDWYVRSESLNLLYQVSKPSDWRVFMNATNDRNMIVRASAVGGLSDFPTHKVRKRVIELLRHDEDALVRRWAAGALESMPNREANIKILVEQSKIDTDPSALAGIYKTLFDMGVGNEYRQLFLSFTDNDDDAGLFVRETVKEWESLESEATPILEAQLDQL